MNETDLRVIKTRESIENAFLSLVLQKPLKKITIVELAREARINKGTFYLHYSDISDLYMQTIHKQIKASFESADYFDDFFDDPKKFCDELNATFSHNLPTMEALAQDRGTSFMQPQTLDTLREKVYATGRIKRCVTNDMKLDALFGALLVCHPRYEAEHSLEMNQLMISMISHFHADCCE